MNMNDIQPWDFPWFPTSERTQHNLFSSNFSLCKYPEIYSLDDGSVENSWPHSAQYIFQKYVFSAFKCSLFPFFLIFLFSYEYVV